MFSGTIHVRERLQFGRGLDAKVTAIAVFEHGSAVQRPAVSAGGVAKLWGLADDPDRRPDRRARDRRTGTSLRPADAGVGRRRGTARRPRATPRRARAARRAGPADRRSAGRRPSGALRLAVRRSPEGGHSVDPGERLRPRGHVLRDDADLHRTADPRRRGDRAAPRRHESVPRDDRAPHRPGARRLRDRVPAAGRSSNDSSVRLQDPRRLRGANGSVRSRGVAGGSLRLGRSPIAS